MEKAALKYWLITRSALTATDADKMCLWSTAGTLNPPGQVPARHPPGTPVPPR